jgi:hypothetical protein
VQFSRVRDSWLAGTCRHLIADRRQAAKNSGDGRGQPATAASACQRAGLWRILTRADLVSQSSIVLSLKEMLMKRIAAVTLSLLSLVAVTGFAADSTKLNGWISDASCGAKHAGSGTACVQGCIKSGSKPVFVDEAKKQVWAIDNPEAVKEAAYGKHVSITATADEGAKSVHITDVSVLTN